MPAPTLIYHFTHIENLPRILEGAALLCKNECGDARNIANAEVQARRGQVNVPVAPHGNLHDYVPFYFAPRSPMMFSIFKGNVPGVQCDTRELVYLVSSIERVEAANLEFVFTNGNAAVTVRRSFFKNLEVLPDVVDWALMASEIWKNTPDDGDRMRKRAAEFLVHRRVPLGLIGGIGVHSDEMKERVETLLMGFPGVRLNASQVRVRTNWFFS